jgi:hypothetical protein
MCEKYLKDESFLNKLKQKMNISKQLMLESKLEGASAFREICKLVCNLLAIEFGENDNENEEDNSEDEQSLTESLNRTLTSKPASKSNKLLNAKSKSARSTKSKKSNISEANKLKNEQEPIEKQIQALENFCIILEVPQFFSDLLKHLISDKPNLKVLKEVYNLTCLTFLSLVLNVFLRFLAIVVSSNRIGHYSFAAYLFLKSIELV